MGVPQNVSIVFGGTDRMLNPKSISFNYLYRLIKIFYAFMSLCTMFLLCRYATVWAITCRNFLA